MTSDRAPAPGPAPSDVPPRVPTPRLALDDTQEIPVVRDLPDDVGRPWPAAPPSRTPAGPAGTARVYADGTALSRYLAGAPAREEWLAWTREHEAELVTTPLGLTELRRIAQPRGVEAHGTAHDVAARIEVARFSDQTLRKATSVTSVLPPFLALHLGAALAHPDVTAVATYDVHLARVAVLHGLAVVTPGWPERWWERDPTPWG